MVGLTVKQIQRISLINKQIKKFNCCLYCIMRFSGIINESDYLLPFKKIRNIISEENNKYSVCCSSPCFTCVNIIKLIKNESFISTIVKSFINNQYESKEYKMNITLPIEVKLRNYYIYLLIKSEYNDTKQINLKFVAKSLIKHYLCNNNITYNGESNISINIEFKSNNKSNIFTNKKQIKIGKRIIKESNTWNNINELLILNFGENFKQKLELYNLMSYKITFYSEPLYIFGYYNKFSREISQTPLILGGKRICKNSVAELCSYGLKEKFKYISYKFHSGGREDIDVRMLGCGRPFILELIEPKKRSKNICLCDLENKINIYGESLIKVNKLKFGNKEDFKKLKDSERCKIKKYLCKVKTINLKENELEIINNMNEIIISQITPIRVMHRRSILERKKKIINMQAQYLNESLFKLLLKTEAGTYVKEFVNSDRGRTFPSVTDIIGKECHIIELDVLDIENID